MSIQAAINQRVVAPVREVLKGRFFYGWVIVGVSFVADFLTAGTGGYTLGLFFRPMGQELGWNRATLSLAASMKNVVNGLSGPAIGPLLDRYGPRVLMAMGGLIAGAGFISLYWVHSPWQFFFMYGFIGALGIAEFGGLITSVTISKWFVRLRGRAVAFATMGVSSGGFVLVPITSWMIGHFGWRVAWVFFGIIIWAFIVVPGALFMRRQPEDMGLLPDGDPAPPKAVPQETETNSPSQVFAPLEERSWTFGEAVRTPAFWLLILTFQLGGMALSAMLIHQIPYIEDKGFSAQMAAGVASIFALFAFLCKLPWGFLVERIHVRYCVMIMYVGSAVALAILIVARSIPVLLLYAAIYGFHIGATGVLNPVAWANYFGRTFIGSIRGLVMPFQIITSATSPLFAGYVFDRTGSYQVAATTFIGTYLLAVVSMFLARQPRPPEVTETPANSLHAPTGSS